MVVRKIEKVFTDLHVLGSHSDRESCYEQTVLMPILLSKLVDAVYEYDKNLGREDVVKSRWESQGYTRVSSESLGFESTEPWYMVFVKTEVRLFPSAPKVIIAVRGTTDLRDVVSDLRLFFQFLHTDSRYHHLKEVTNQLVQRFGHKSVSMAGHSLGAAFVLLVARGLVKMNTPVETYLFNPVFLSFDSFRCKSLRRLGRSCTAMLLAVHTLLSVSKSIRDRLELIRNDYSSMNAWIPNLFLNHGDLLNRGFIHRIIDKIAHNDSGFESKINKWVASFSLFSLFSTRAHPKHLLPSVNFTIAPAIGNPLRSHALEQWFGDSEWESADMVGGLEFGRQLCQRKYRMRRKFIQVENSDVKVMAYCQTLTASFIQTAILTVTVGLATSKQKQIILLFNTEQDAEVAMKLWPSDLNYDEFENCLRHSGSFIFQRRKFWKGGVTYYFYAVRRDCDLFWRELEWRAMLRDFELMEDVTNWIKNFRRGVWTLLIF